MIGDYLALGQMGRYQLKNQFMTGFAERPVSIAVLLLAGGGFLGGFIYLAFLLLRFIYGQEVYGVLFATKLVEFMLFISVGMSLMSSLTNAIAHYFLSKDLEFQFSLPVNFYSWMLHRFTGVFLQSNWMLLLFGGSFIWIYLYLGGANVLVQGLGLVLFALLVSFPIVFSSLLCMLLVKIFPAKRVHQVFLVLTVVMVSSLILLFRYLEPERFLGPGGLEQFRGFVDLINTDRQPYNPAVWTGHALTAMSQGQWQSFWVPAGKLVGLFLASMGLFLAVARRVYRSSWDRALQSLSGEGDLRPRDSRQGWFSRQLGHPIFSQEIREALLFFRDPSQWSQVFVLAALLGLYLFSVTRVPDNLLGATSYIMAMLNSIFVAFISLSISSRFVFTSFSADGQAIWLMKTAPDGWVKFIRSKLLFYGLPCLIFCLILSVVSGYILGLKSEALWAVGLSALWDGSLMVMLSLCLGMLFVNPMVENPIKLIVSPGGLFLMALGLFLAAIHLLIRLTANIFILNEAMMEYGWPNMQDGRDVWYILGMLLVEVVLVTVLFRRGLAHLRSGIYSG